MDRQPISQEGYDKIREQIKQLEEHDMPRITQAIAEARAEGDLSENAEYHAQREAQGLLQAKINLLKTQLAHAYIVDKTTMPKGVVTFGSKVTVRDVDDGTEEMYEFVGPGETDYDGAVMKILSSSPLATSLMGKKPGDFVEVPLPRGRQRLEVIAVDDA